MKIQYRTDIKSKVLYFLGFYFICVTSVSKYIIFPIIYVLLIYFIIANKLLLIKLLSILFEKYNAKMYI